MDKNQKISTKRIDGLSDAVIAIIITIMVLAIPIPEEITHESVIALVRSIGIFFVSFIVVGAQWYKHRQLFDHFESVPEKVAWRNILYLFFLSLMPLFVEWVIKHPGQVTPAVGYNMVYIGVIFSYQFMQNGLVDATDGSQDTWLLQLREMRESIERPWMLFVRVVLGLLIIFILSFFYPTVSIVFFLAWPVFSSLLNMWVERNYEHKRGLNVQNRRRGKR